MGASSPKEADGGFKLFLGSFLYLGAGRNRLELCWDELEAIFIKVVGSIGHDSIICRLVDLEIWMSFLYSTSWAMDEVFYIVLGLMWQKTFTYFVCKKAWWHFQKWRPRTNLIPHWGNVPHAWDITMTIKHHCIFILFYFSIFLVSH